MGTAKADLGRGPADLRTGQSGSDDDQDVQFDDLSLPPGPLSSSSSTIIGMKPGGKQPERLRRPARARPAADQGPSDSDVRLMPADSHPMPERLRRDPGQRRPVVDRAWTP